MKNVPPAGIVTVSEVVSPVTRVNVPAPAGPVGPVAPVGPVEPAPVGPAGPLGPVDPVAVDDAPTDVHCYFTTPADIHQTISDVQAGNLTDPVFAVEAPVLADVSVTTANTKVNLTCTVEDLSGYGGARIQNASMIAVPVTAVTPAS